MSYDRQLITGIVGTIVSALCCFTPMLGILLSAVGLSAITGWLDYVLIPALVFFVALTIIAVRKKNKLD